MIRFDERPADTDVHHSLQPSTTRIGYLVNQYPKVSHTFIRREILELEARGVQVFRYAIRGFADVLVDEADALERRRTAYLLGGGWRTCAAALLQTAMQRPRRFMRALRTCLALSVHADRPLPFHLLYLVEACRLARWMRRDKVIHLHAHFGTNSAEVALLAGILGNVPYSFTVHGPEEFDKPEALHVRTKIDHAAFVIAVSSFGRSQLYRLVSYKQWAKIHVVHCALALSDFPPGRDQPAQSNRIVCVGRLCEQKGQLLLIDAARELVARGIDVELVLAGDGDMRPAIEEHVRRHGLEAIVRITGWIGAGQVRNEILHARALVLPSFAEGLPVVLMEAMALERPVLTTWVAGIPELVTHGQTGWLFPPGDVDALVTALTELFRTPAHHLMGMGRQGRRKIQAQHEISAEVTKLLACIVAHQQARVGHG